MEQVGRVTIEGTLERLHGRLESHFGQLAGARNTHAPGAPVFALEHGLDDEDLGSLKDAVRAAVAAGFGTSYKKWWLPFAVYAAESGYGYEGGEYWVTFADETPRWTEVGNNSWIRSQFIKFADQFNGVRPRGAFAEHFPIIAWPITHAVLPVYLQRNLAQLLFEFRAALTSDLLRDPEALGARLAARTASYTERFRIFCENTALLGSVAIALLGETAESPYLSTPTQQRLAESMSRESVTRRWLDSARGAASGVRARGFRSSARSTNPRDVESARVAAPCPTDVGLELRRRDGAWRLHAVLPDLTVISRRLPETFEHLRSRRTTVEGLDGPPLARGRLLFAGQSVRLLRWPRPDAPFLQVLGAPDHINRVLADLCVVRGGPIWLFIERVNGLAQQVRTRVLRPGRTYILVQPGSEPAPGLEWSSPTSLDVDGMRAQRLQVPDQIGDEDRAALIAIGLHVVTDIIVSPVGVVPSAWDGGGLMEWSAGEHAAIAITANSDPSQCELTLDGVTYLMEWPAGKSRVLVGLGNLEVGAHALRVRLFAGHNVLSASEDLFITVRDPLVRSESATEAEGLRVLASPARPSMADLWDGRATLSVLGPAGLAADLRVTLRSDTGGQLVHIQRSVQLPVDENRWLSIARSIREHNSFRDAYDEAESVEIAVARSGVGFATIHADRGFRPLRWKISRHHGHGRIARLIDRTDGAATRVELYSFEDPLTPTPQDGGAPIEIPPLGGLLRAVAGEVVESVLLPTQPNAVMRAGRLRPKVEIRAKTSQEIHRLSLCHRMWSEADLPADPFAHNRRAHVLDAIVREIASEFGGSYWRSAERRLNAAQRPLDHIDDLQAAVGIDQRQKALASEISRRLWRWSDPAELRSGFADVIASTLRRTGLDDVADSSLYLMHLADDLSALCDWDADQSSKIVSAVVRAPVLLRAARFAVLGARAFSEDEPTRRGAH